MTRRRWIYPGNGQPPFEVTRDYCPQPLGPMVMGDLPGYESPVTGQWVEGRVARRNDLARTNSRPWEGLEQEKKEAARQESYANQAYEQDLSMATQKAWAQLDPAKRRQLMDY